MRPDVALDRVHRHGELVGDLAGGEQRRQQREDGRSRSLSRTAGSATTAARAAATRAANGPRPFAGGPGGEQPLGARPGQSEGPDHAEALRAPAPPPARHGRSPGRRPAARPPLRAGAPRPPCGGGGRGRPGSSTGATMIAAAAVPARGGLGPGLEQQGLPGRADPGGRATRRPPRRRAGCRSAAPPGARGRPGRSSMRRRRRRVPKSARAARSSASPAARCPRSARRRAVHGAQGVRGFGRQRVPVARASLGRARPQRPGRRASRSA